ncbi:DNA polymerase IV [Pseudostreptobacillus hongkongensis]|uniref:DNA polymerase IV n=1 Tax=Pseudostreptobacillus hongkongensis TaxID=1162717 RepID=UPI0008298C0A|nr:DNA polymerase IV [Pseudostreptobacillus hongkongensis]
MEKIILHIDMNNCYASIEAKLNPKLKNKAIAVCGSKLDRHGIVLAKSELAKKYGVKSAETINSALKKCPNLIIVPPHYDEYIKHSKLARNIYYEYTDLVEPFGIDECWCDITGSIKLFGSAENIAESIRSRIKNELGITVSIGISFNKTFAKLGSDLKKPDAITIISKENFKDKVWNLDISEMIGIGKNTQNRLRELGINTLGELANFDKIKLSKVLGKHGSILHDRANGIDDSPVTDMNFKKTPKSISNGKTLSKDIYTKNEARDLFSDLSIEISNKLKEYQLHTTTLQITVRNVDFVDKQYQCEIDQTSSEFIITETAMKLLEKYKWDKPIRSLTINTKNLVSEDSYQLSLFEEKEEYEKIKKIDKTIYDIRKKFGDDFISFGKVKK